MARISNPMHSPPWIHTVFLLLATLTSAQELRVDLDATMVTNEADVGDPSGLVDEQRLIVGPPVGKPPQTRQCPIIRRRNCGE